MMNEKKIYILETGEDKKEYRIATLYPEDIINMNLNKENIPTFNEDIRIQNAKLLWGDSDIYETEEQALDMAFTIRDSFPNDIDMDMSVNIISILRTLD